MSRTIHRIVFLYRVALVALLILLTTSLLLSSASASASASWSTRPSVDFRAGGGCDAFLLSPVFPSSSTPFVSARIRSAPFPPSPLRSCAVRSDLLNRCHLSRDSINGARLKSAKFDHSPLSTRATTSAATSDAEATIPSHDNHDFHTNDQGFSASEKKETRPRNRRQPSSPSPSLVLPRHVAFICDGNSRWAERRTFPLPAALGYAAGADRVISVLRQLMALSREGKGGGGAEGGANATVLGRVEVCTLYAFSTENWSRPSLETSAFMALLERVVDKYHDEAMGKFVVRILGDLDDTRVPEGTRNALRRLEVDTARAAGLMGGENDATDADAVSGGKHIPGRPGDGILTVCLAINYGGRSDILSAVRSLVGSIAENGEGGDAENITEAEFSRRLSTSGLPDPDLIVRTGGERRLSNFLLWNAAYAEIYFSDDLWPDFDDSALDDALLWYGKRKRNFGGRT